MKKVLALALAALMVMALFVGCGKKEDPVNSSGGSSVAPSGTTSAGQSKLDKIKASGKIVMATSPDFAPSEFIDPTKKGQEQYVGTDIEVGKYIAEALGVELEIQAMDFQACQAAVTTGSVDMAISGFAWREDRAENMGLSEPYNVSKEKNTQGLIIRKEDADKYKTLADFAGKKVAAQEASLQAELVADQLPADVKVESFSSLNDAIMMLSTGKVDAVAVAKDNGEGFAKNYQELQMCEAWFDYTSKGTVIAVTKGEDELLEEINKIVADITAKGLYDTWKADAIELANSLGIDLD